LETDDIDYKALYEGLQSELEQARIAILTMRQTRNPLDKLDMDKVRTFVHKNYVMIVVAIMLLTFVVSSLKTIKSLFKDSKE
jgi:hypothetical protein